MDHQKLDLSKTALGIELGSTRIKAILIGANYTPIASGEHQWKDHYEHGIWTYHLGDVWTGIQKAYQQLSNEVKEKYNTTLSNVGSIGISAMMHGYLPFDSDENQLTSFRTWKNTTTETAAEELTSLFQFNIPLRWSVAHLYQAVLNQEDHVNQIDFLTTLAGYVHWKLTGKKVLGIGEASGMFPIKSETGDYDGIMMEQFNDLMKRKGYTLSLESILPQIQLAGTQAGTLTSEGAELLDPTGKLKSGIPLCPPEGDAGTGMVATNSTAERTGNISAGTSVFAMIVLEKSLSDYYTEIDIVTTPTGKPVSMVHCNNFTSDINAWANLFSEVFQAHGKQVSNEEMFTVLFKQALKAKSDVDGIVNCNYYSGEPITGFKEGRPLLVRKPNSNLTLPNFMRAHIYSALATLKIGMDILTTKEKVKVNYILGHGGFFKTEKVGQQLMADALGIPVSVMNTAGEGGPWGMALLAAYALNKQEGQTLEDFINREVFATEKTKTTDPTEQGIMNFQAYMNQYHSILNVEREAINSFK